MKTTVKPRCYPSRVYRVTNLICLILFYLTPTSGQSEVSSVFIEANGEISESSSSSVQQQFDSNGPDNDYREDSERELTSYVKIRKKKRQPLIKNGMNSKKLFKSLPVKGKGGSYKTRKRKRRPPPDYENCWEYRYHQDNFRRRKNGSKKSNTKNRGIVKMKEKVPCPPVTPPDADPPIRKDWLLKLFHPALKPPTGQKQPSKVPTIVVPSDSNDFPSRSPEGRADAAVDARGESGPLGGSPAIGFDEQPVGPP